MKNLAIALMFLLWIISTIILTVSIFGILVMIYVDEYFEIPCGLIDKLG